MCVSVLPGLTPALNAFNPQITDQDPHIAMPPRCRQVTLKAESLAECSHSAGAHDFTSNYGRYSGTHRILNAVARHQRANVTADTVR